MFCAHTANEWQRIATEEIREMLLDQVEGECGMCGVPVRKPSALACLPHWTIERKMSIEPGVLVKGAGAFGELSEIVQIGCQRDAAGLLH
jgi:hypothetical protein